MGSDTNAKIDLIAQFLRELWKHALREIGHEMEIEALPLRVALTLPAIWPTYARERMKEAAKRAGITNKRPVGETRLILVEEPEAAALSTLFERRDHPEIQVGETFIVCDCGGGTVVCVILTAFLLARQTKASGRIS
jgi:molecular chaperone DnaK (HSP70)